MAAVTLAASSAVPAERGYPSDRPPSPTTRSIRLVYREGPGWAAVPGQGQAGHHAVPVEEFVHAFAAASDVCPVPCTVPPHVPSAHQEEAQARENPGPSPTGGRHMV